LDRGYEICRSFIQKNILKELPEIIAKKLYKDAIGLIIALGAFIASAIFNITCHLYTINRHHPWADYSGYTYWKSYSGNL